jgi:hypothetical protein
MDAIEHDLFERLTRRNPEDNFVERKPESVKAHELRKTLVAFSNSLQEQQTAVLFIGVDDRTGKIVGVDNTDALQKRVAEAGENCYPAIRPVMRVLEVDGKSVVGVEVAHSKDKPHFAGPAYIRSGSRSVKASDSLYRDLLTSHCSTAGELLKWKGKCVTIRTSDKKLGNHYPDWEPGMHKEGTATVLSVEPFSATFHFVEGGGEKCTEPLSRIELDWDSVRNRRRIIVRGTPP